MAQIQEEVLVIKFSKLVKNSDSADGIVTEEIINSLEQVAQELADKGVIVEVEKV